MIYNERYSIFTDFNTKDVKIFDEREQKFLLITFDSEEEAKRHLRETMGEMEA